MGFLLSTGWNKLQFTRGLHPSRTSFYLNIHNIARVCLFSPCKLFEERTVMRPVLVQHLAWWHLPRLWLTAKGVGSQEDGGKESTFHFWEMVPKLGISSDKHILHKRKTTHRGSCHSTAYEPYFSSRTSKPPLHISAKQGVLGKDKTEEVHETSVYQTLLKAKPLEMTTCLQYILQEVWVHICSDMSRLQGRKQKHVCSVTSWPQ